MEEVPPQLLEKQFLFLFEQLAIAGTSTHIEKFIRAPEVHQPLPGGAVKKVKGESVEGLAD